jgi:hypothetical protein
MTDGQPDRHGFLLFLMDESFFPDKADCRKPTVERSVTVPLRFSGLRETTLS